MSRYQRRSYSDLRKEVSVLGRAARPSPARDPGRYLFTLVDARGGKLYSGLRKEGENAMEVTSLDDGSKQILFTVPRRRGYAEQCLDLRDRLEEFTGRKIVQHKLV